MAEFIFKGVEGEQARVGLLVSDTEVHDFLMGMGELKANIAKFGEHPELLKAEDALALAGLADKS